MRWLVLVVLLLVAGGAGGYLGARLALQGEEGVAVGPDGLYPRDLLEGVPLGSERAKLLAENNRRFNEAAARFASNPPFVGELNGITFYSDDDFLPHTPCQFKDVEINPDVARRQVAGTPMDIRPSYLPYGIPPVPQEEGFWGCNGRVYHALRRFSGVGGNVEVARWVYPHVSARAPRQYLEPTAIAGRPAVVQRNELYFNPVFQRNDPAGLQAVIVREEWGLTIVQSFMPIEELVKVAAGLNR